MTDRDRFLRATCENPADDLRRLAFADWLVDTAQPSDPEWADFIRVQCEREQVEGIEHTCRPHPDGGPDIGETECPACGAHWAADELRNREFDLMGRIASRVAGPLIQEIWGTREFVAGWDGVVEPMGHGPGSIQFRRGFLWGVACDAPRWVRAVAEIAWHPDWAVPCEACEEQAPDWETNVVECSRCECTGLVAQPCPVEPMPVEFVTLFGRPREADFGPEPFTRRTGKPGWEHVRWPGVVFELPGE